MNRSRLLLGVNPASKLVLLYVFVLLSLVTYTILRVNNLSQAVQRVKSTADTTAYLRISREPVLSGEFLAGSRPMLFPLVLKLLQQDEEVVAWAQGIFSILSWGTLAIVLAVSLQTNLMKFVAGGMVLLVSLHQHIIAWDSVMLTESLSLSLMAAFLGSWLWLLRGWRWSKAFVVIVLALAWSLCRDTNAWVLLMIAVVVFMLVIPGVADKKFLVFSLAFGIMFFLSNFTADLGGRWVYPFQNVLGRRLLSDPQALTFLQDCGMPVSPALLNMAGEYADGQDRAFYNSPALENYRSWLDKHGKSCYTRWLLSNPIRVLKQPFGNFNVLVGIQNLPAFLLSRRFSPILPARVEAILTLRQQALLTFFLTSIAALIALFSRCWVKINAWWIPILLIALIFPHYFIIWHGDVQGIERHAVAVGIQLYLGMWILVLLVLDGALASIRNRIENQKEILNWKAKP